MKEQPEVPDGKAPMPLEVYYLRDVPKPHVFKGQMSKLQT